jgi:hypothetical protein
MVIREQGGATSIGETVTAASMNDERNFTQVSTNQRP